LGRPEPKKKSEEPTEEEAMDIENGFLRIVQAEIDLLRELEGLKRDLPLHFGYSHFQAFNHLNKGAVGDLDAEKIADFLKDNGAEATEDEVMAIIRRVDA